VTLSPEKEVIQGLATKRRTSGTPNSILIKKVKAFVKRLYKTDSDMPDSDFTTDETDEFTAEDNCEKCLDCISQLLESEDFVIIKLATKKTVKYVVELIQEIWPDGYYN
jgi:hypothetical protein